jgi:hypothetical protein
VCFKKRVYHTISKVCETIRTALSFLPLLRPFIMSEQVRRSMIGHCIPQIGQILLSTPTISFLDQEFSYLSLSESLGSISASRMGYVDGASDVDVISQRNVANLNIIVCPFPKSQFPMILRVFSRHALIPLVEQLCASQIRHNILWERVEGTLNIITGFRHDCASFDDGSLCA